MIINCSSDCKVKNAGIGETMGQYLVMEERWVCEVLSQRERTTGIFICINTFSAYHMDRFYNY